MSRATLGAVSLLFVVLGLAAVLALPALAHPSGKPGKSNGNHARKQAKQLQKELFRTGGGPPPWAPAHGYRRKQGDARVYVAPFGIDLGTCKRKLMGAAIGAAAGGLLASEVAEGSNRAVAIAGGAILGAAIGGSIGRSMDQLDRHCVGQILEYAPTREAVAWKNPDNENSYTVTADRTYRDEDERYCREYHTTGVVGGEPQETYGTACRQPDGSWQILN